MKMQKIQKYHNIKHFKRQLGRYRMIPSLYSTMQKSKNPFLPHNFVGSLLDNVAHLRHVDRVDTGGIGELFGEDVRNANLVHVLVGVGRDHGTTRVVHPLAHHVLAEQALFLLQNLWEMGRIDLYLFPLDFFKNYKMP